MRAGVKIRADETLNISTSQLQSEPGFQRFYSVSRFFTENCTETEAGEARGHEKWRIKRYKQLNNEQPFVLFIQYPPDEGLFLLFSNPTNGSLLFNQSEVPCISLGD